DSNRVEALQIKVLNVGRRRLEDHLELIIVLKPVGILAIAAVLGPARGLDIGCTPRLRPERAQGGRGMECRRSHLHVVRLEDDAALVGPKPLKLQDQVLKGQGLRRTRLGRFGGVFSTFIHPVFFKSLSLPGLTGQSSNPGAQTTINIGDYWIPAFAGMTLHSAISKMTNVGASAGRCRLQGRAPSARWAWHPAGQYPLLRREVRRQYADALGLTSAFQRGIVQRRRQIKEALAASFRTRNATRARALRSPR